MTPLEPWQERLLKERDELIDKLLALNLFFLSEKWTHVHPLVQDLMKQQHKVMKEYLEILNRRIDVFQ
jgi:hypothetical protein